MQQTAAGMFEWLSDDLEFMSDVRAADWIVSSLAPWGRDGVRLTSFMPSTFAAYARIFHPAEDRLATHRWADLGAPHGVGLSPEIGFAEVMGLRIGEDGWPTHYPDLMPSEGTLPHEQCRILGEILAGYTHTPAVCWFGVWAGWGSLRPGSPLTLDRTRRWPPRPPRHHPRWWITVRGLRQARKEYRREQAIPRVQMPNNRDQYLFRGPVRAACSFEPFPGDRLSPSAWWPDDREWMVVTEVDGFTSYVGGTRAGIDAILASPDLESIEVPHDVRLVSW